MSRSPRQELPEDLRIQSVAYGGLGVARRESGEVVFVRGGLPGDLLRVGLRKKRRRHREGRLLELLEAGPDRIEAACRHQSVCGGCPLQSLDYPAQLVEKERMVRDAWLRIAGLQPDAWEPILPAARTTHYRNKMEFTFSDQQWVELDDGAQRPETDFGLGQHVPGIHSKVFDLEQCLLQSEWTAPILAEIRRFVREEGGGKDAVWHFVHQTGFWRFVVIREGKRTGERLINLITTEAGDPRVTALAERLLEEFPGQITGIVNTVNPGKGQVATGRLDRVLHGDGLLHEELGGLTFQLAPQAFFQTNTEQAEVLFARVAELLEPRPGEHLLDLYCGTGAIALLMAPHVEHVTGVELVPEAVESARVNARLNGLDHKVDFHCGDVLELLRQGELRPPGLLVVDPPRAGLHPKVVSEILELAPRRLVYVSCNPATQARDVALLAEGGYRPRVAQAVDLFPHTYHVESVALFTR